MRTRITIYTAYSIVVIAVILTFWYLCGGNFLYYSLQPDPTKAKDIAPFMTGLIAPMISLAGIFLLFRNLMQTQISQFETNFYKQIDNYYKIVANIGDIVDDINDDSTEKSTKADFFDDLAFRIAIDFNKETICIDFQNSKDGNPSKKKDLKPLCPQFDHLPDHDRLVAIYGYYFDIHQSSLGHYFRNLYHTFKYIKHSNMISTGEKKKYAKILRAQLTNYEILLLAYNGLYKYGGKFKPIIEEYALLKNLNFELDLTNKHHKRIIDNKDVLINAYPHLEEPYNEQLQMQVEVKN